MISSRNLLPPTSPELLIYVTKTIRPLAWYTGLENNPAVLEINKPGKGVTGTVREGQGWSGLCGVHVGNLRLKSAGGSMDKSTYRAAGPFPKRNTDWLLFFFNAEYGFRAPSDASRDPYL